MTWNLLWRFRPAWQRREAGIVATLRQVRPDVAGLVETWSAGGTTQPHRLATMAGGLTSAWVPTSLPPAPDPPEEPSQAGAAVGIGLLSRWPIAGTVVRELPHPGRPGPPPTALVATLDRPGGPLRVIVTAAEWEPRYAADQLAQCRELAALATASSLPTVLIGDFNAAPGQPGLRPLLAVLTDAWAAAGGDPGAVTLASAVPFAPLEARDLIDRRIDHVLSRGLRPRAAFLAGDRPVDGLHPSDHAAVVVDFEDF